VRFPLLIIISLLLTSRAFAQPVAGAGLLNLQASLHDTDSFATEATGAGIAADSISYDPLSLHIDSMIAFGKTLLGKPYRYRGAAPWPMDCSGYVNLIFSRFGYSLPRSSRDIARAVPEVNLKEIRRGDLLFFRGRNSGSPGVGHVGIVFDVTPEGILMIHSSTSRGIVIENISNLAYYQRRLVKAGRPDFRISS